MSPSSKKRIKTRYPGVYYYEDAKGKRTLYIRYFKAGNYVEEKAPPSAPTPKKASGIRALRATGAAPTNAEKRQQERAAKLAKAEKWTFNRLWDAYRDSKPDLKGFATDKNRYELHIKPDFGHKEPKELIPLDVDRLRIRLLKSRKPQTVKNTLALLIRVANFGKKQKNCEGLLFTVTMPRVDNEKTEDLTPKQLTRLLKALDEAKDQEVAAMMRMALCTGMRRGELFRLQWEDVDFRSGFITIRSPKGGKTQQIPLNSVAREILQGRDMEYSPYVFPDRNGNQRKSARKPAIAIRDAAKLPDGFRPFHGLRHVYASMMASSGKVDMYTLQKLLTHKSPQMTQRYAHLRDATLKKAAELAGDLIAQQVAEAVESEKNAKKSS